MLNFMKVNDSNFLSFFVLFLLNLLDLSGIQQCLWCLLQCNFLKGIKVRQFLGWSWLINIPCNSPRCNKTLAKFEI